MAELTASKADRTKWKWLAGGAVVLFVFLALLDTPIWRPRAIFTQRHNTQIAEAQAWWQGRLDIPERRHDTALYEGKVYSHFPPLFTIIAAAFVPMFASVPHWVIGLLIVLPIPILAYGLFLRIGAPVWQAVLLALGLVCGTSIWPVIDRTLKNASPYFVNHCLATIGLLLFLLELKGRRRVAVAGPVLIATTLARQLTAAFLWPLAWITLRLSDSTKKKRSFTGIILVATIMVALPAIFNTMKFGSPINSGYMNIYEGRDDHFAKDAHRYGLFSPHFVLRNLYYLNVGLPRLHEITMAGKKEWHLRPNMMGTGIWWTSPILLWLLIDFRRITADPTSRSLLIGIGAIFAVLLFFHATGADQRGYNRFSLDFMPVLMTVIAPSCFKGKRAWISIAMILWSIVYFRCLI